MLRMLILDIDITQLNTATERDDEEIFEAGSF